MVDVVAALVAARSRAAATRRRAIAAARRRLGRERRRVARRARRAGRPRRRVGDDHARPRPSPSCAAASTFAPSVDPERPTGTCVVLVEPGGERTMLPDAGANDGAAAPSCRAGEHLHVVGYALLRDGSRASALAAIERARAARHDASSVDPVVGGAAGATPARSPARSTCCCPTRTRRCSAAAAGRAARSS